MKNKFVLIGFSSLFLVLTIAIVYLIIVVNKDKEVDSADIFKNSLKSVVELKASSSDDNYVTYGTAVFIDENTLVTNAHMVTYKQSGVYNEYTKIEIRFSFEADYRQVFLMNYDLNKDLAFIKFNDTTANYKACTLNDKKIHSGDIVYAVGNGMNHGIGITKGLVSLPLVNIEYDNYIKEVIQCDLIINDGNSGGALLDKNGKLIGITTFRLKDNSGNVIYGIAYCIPISIVLGYYNSL